MNELASAVTVSESEEPPVITQSLFPESSTVYMYHSEWEAAVELYLDIPDRRCAVGLGRTRPPISRLADNLAYDFVVKLDRVLGVTNQSLGVCRQSI